MLMHIMRAYTQRVSTTFFDREKTLTLFSCATDAGGIRTFGSLGLESDALPTEPPRDPIFGTVERT